MQLPQLSPKQLDAQLLKVQLPPEQLPVEQLEHAEQLSQLLQLLSQQSGLTRPTGSAAHVGPMNKGDLPVVAGATPDDVERLYAYIP